MHTTGLTFSLEREGWGGESRERTREAPFLGCKVHRCFSVETKATPHLDGALGQQERGLLLCAQAEPQAWVADSHQSSPSDLILPGSEAVGGGSEAGGTGWGTGQEHSPALLWHLLGDPFGRPLLRLQVGVQGPGGGCVSDIE